MYLHVVFNQYSVIQQWGFYTHIEIESLISRSFYYNRLQTIANKLSPVRFKNNKI